jgi:transposase
VALRRAGGVPTYLLTDNEKTVTVEHVAGIAVRNLAAVAFGRHYGLTVATCVPYDPASKGGSESTVTVAKADLVPTDANLGFREPRPALRPRLEDIRWLALSLTDSDTGERITRCVGSTSAVIRSQSR